MAPTRRRRQTKHRGNAAGVVERRGRTGRKDSDSATAKSSGGSGKQPGKAVNRYDRPPTWRSAATRALVATGIFLVAIIVVLNQPAKAGISLAGFMLILYVPLTYYTDMWLYRRRQRQKLRARDQKK